MYAVNLGLVTIHRIIFYHKYELFVNTGSVRLLVTTVTNNIKELRTD